jgi:hypothetical protein
MVDSRDSGGEPDPEATEWLLLIHQLPPKPDYLRVKVRRRLQRLGAVPLRGSVYVLPDTEESREDFLWLLGEIQAEGGEAMLCRAAFVEGITDRELRAMFETSGSPAVASPTVSGVERVKPGRTWVTRRNVHVDRMASAWLIRRGIDPEARFKFVAPRGYRPEPGELRFDMAQAEYSHEGERCTFQVLLERFGLDDLALAAIGEIVRDIDCKDTKYGREETAGIAALLAGIAESEPEDLARLAQAAPIFAGLWQHFGSRLA